METNEDAKPIVVSDFWYDLTDGGYIDPNVLLKHKSDAQKVQEAIGTLMLFKETLEANDLIEEM